MWANGCNVVVDSPRELIFVPADDFKQAGISYPPQFRQRLDFDVITDRGGRVVRVTNLVERKGLVAEVLF
jgi:hypothetical protein